MKQIINYLLVCSVVCGGGCELASSTERIDEEVYKRNAIPIGDKLSAASKRALERNTIQFAEDGINFEIKSHIQWGPHAAGLVRSLDTNKSPLEAMRWGLCHEYKGDWQYIRRFESYVPHAL